MSHERTWLPFKGHINTSLVMLSELNSPISFFLETPIVKTKTKLRTITHVYARHRHVHAHAHTYSHRYIQRHREERKRPTHIQTYTYKDRHTYTDTHSHTQKTNMSGRDLMVRQGIQSSWKSSGGSLPLNLPIRPKKTQPFLKKQERSRACTLELSSQPPLLLH